MSVLTRIETLLTPAIEALGYDLVRLRLEGSGRKRLQIMAEPKDGRPMSLEDCSEISRVVSALLDVEDPIAGAYSLEVSSPGIDRPLTKAQDFARFAGEGAKLELNTPIAGRKRFAGQLLGIENDQVLLLAEGERIALPLAGIHKAKLAPKAAPEAAMPTSRAPSQRG